MSAVFSLNEFQQISLLEHIRFAELGGNPAVLPDGIQAAIPSRRIESGEGFGRLESDRVEFEVPCMRWI